MQYKEDWQPLFEQEMKKAYWKKLSSFLDIAYQEKNIYPQRENIFKAFQTTSLRDTKVVLLGQDPYHGPGQAQGYAFSVPKSFPLPPSLKNIYKEIENEYAVSLDKDGDLTSWASQGVLLLNTILTVEKGQPLSHFKLGWQQFTNQVLSTINQKEDAVVYLLWGAKAQEVLPLLTNPKHLILKSAHPSPFYCRKGFFGNNHFKLTNDFLIQHNKTPIEWF